MSKIIQVTPCEHWFYAHFDDDEGDWTVTPLAAWGLTDEGEVLGLLPVTSGADTDTNFPKLVPAPNVGGRIIHGSKMTPMQISASKFPSR